MTAVTASTDKTATPSFFHILAASRGDWTHPVVELQHDIGLYTDLNRGNEMSDGHEWQAQRILGERQTPQGLEPQTDNQNMIRPQVYHQFENGVNAKYDESEIPELHGKR
jgi:hypothetical protein